MTSREIVRRVVRRQQPERIAWDFLDPRYQDIQFVSPIRLVDEATAPYRQFGDYEEIKARAAFHGEVRVDPYGNIYGRLNHKTNGECVRGALEEGWEALENYSFPEIDMQHIAECKAADYQKNSDKYILTYLPMGVFSTLRDLRKMDNALMDTAAEPEMVEEYMKKFTPFALKQISLAADCGVDGVILCDDWGMQFSPFVNPTTFHELFAPVYRQLTGLCHARGIDFMLHSCGYVLPLVEDMIAAGIDVLQFDQPDAAGVDLWAEKYSDRVSFYCPVDIQKIMPTGDREYIEKSALHMAEAFASHGRALIAKDYPSWSDINVQREWAQWATDVIVAHS